MSYNNLICTCYFTCSSRVAQSIMQREFKTADKVYLEVVFSLSDIMRQASPIDEWLIELCMPHELMYDQTGCKYRNYIDCSVGVPIDWIRGIRPFKPSVDKQNDKKPKGRNTLKLGYKMEFLNSCLYDVMKVDCSDTEFIDKAALAEMVNYKLRTFDAFNMNQMEFERRLLAIIDCINTAPTFTRLLDSKKQATWEKSEFDRFAKCSNCGYDKLSWDWIKSAEVKNCPGCGYFVK